MISDIIAVFTVFVIKWQNKNKNAAFENKILIIQNLSGNVSLYDEDMVYGWRQPWCPYCNYII